MLITVALKAVQVILERVPTLFPPFTGYGVFFFPPILCTLSFRAGEERVSHLEEV